MFSRRQAATLEMQWLHWQSSASPVLFLHARGQLPGCMVGAAATSAVGLVQPFPPQRGLGDPPPLPAAHTCTHMPRRHVRCCVVRAACHCCRACCKVITCCAHMPTHAPQECAHPRLHPEWLPRLWWDAWGAHACCCTGHALPPALQLALAWACAHACTHACTPAYILIT